MTRLSNHSGQSETSFLFFLVICTFSALNANPVYLKVRTCTRFLHLKAEGLTYFFALRSLDPKLIGCKDPIWINPDLTKTERDVRFRLRLKKRNAKKVNEEKKVADLNEDKCATNPGSAMQALQNENRLVVADNANVERNSNSAVADKLPVKSTNISSSASPADITESKTARSSDQVSSSGRLSKN